MTAKRQGRAAMLLIALFVGGMIFSALHNYWTEFWIAQDPRPMSAAITSELSHGVLEYQYQVNGVFYSGQGQRGRNLDRGAHVGTQTPIWVSTSHPWLSSPDMPTFSPWTPLAIMAALVSIEFFVLKNLVTLRRSSNKLLPTMDQPVP